MPSSLVTRTDQRLSVKRDDTKIVCILGAGGHSATEYYFHSHHHLLGTAQAAHFVLVDRDATRLNKVDLSKLGEHTHEARVVDVRNGLGFKLTSTQAVDAILVLAIPGSRLLQLQNGIEAGFRNIIIEHSFAVDPDELNAIEALVKTRRDVKFFFAEHYYSKAIALEWLAGSLPRDSELVKFVSASWIRPGGGLAPLNTDELLQVHGSLSTRLGKVQGVTAKITEGGRYGIQAMLERPWLFRSQAETGSSAPVGMIDDLFWHPLAFVEAGDIVRMQDLNIEASYRRRLPFVDGSFQSKLIACKPGDIETDAIVRLKASNGSTDNFAFTTWFNKHGGPDDARHWKVIVRGSNGAIYGSMRRSANYFVQSNKPEKQVLELKIPEQSYDPLFAKARLYFSGKMPPSFDGYVSSALKIGRLIFEAVEKSAANAHWGEGKSWARTY